MSTIEQPFSGQDKRIILFGISEQLKEQGNPHSIFHADAILKTMDKTEARSFLPKGK